MEKYLFGAEELLPWEILVLPGNCAPQKNEAYIRNPFLQYSTVILEQ